MHVKTQTCLLFLLVSTPTFVRSQDCTLEQFINSPLYDSNFDTTDLEASYPSGRQVRVSCNVGFSGFFRLFCVEGRWMSRGNKCQPRPCGYPGDAQFAEFHLAQGDDFVFGSKVEYTCHKGYQMITRTNYRNCMADGWDGVVPVCEPQHCSVIHVDRNVQVNGDPEEATFGNVVRFSCKSNKEILFGPAEIYCDENGEWSGPAPKCKEITCMAPTIENGDVLGDIKEYKEHEVLQFLCHDKYKPSEERSPKCTKIGPTADWSPTPLCELITCKLKAPIEGTSYDPAYRNVFSPGDTMRVTCGNKYWISNPRETSAVVTCREDGEWSVSLPCKEVTCSRPRDPNHYNFNVINVYWGQKVTLGAIAEYDCRTGYKSTDGTNRATCTRDGWRPNPLCQEIICEPVEIPNAELVDPKWRYKNGQKANYECNDGYRGNPTRTCGRDGWTGYSECREIICDKKEIPNAEIADPKQRYKYREQANYVCKDGYSGNPTRTCEKNGWTGYSQCTEIICELVGIPNAEPVSPTWRYKNGQKANYECNDGYRGNPTRTCGENGWTGNSTCSEITCDQLDIPNAEIVNPKQRYKYKDQVKYKCEDGYRGNPSRTCEKKGWTGNSQCTACPTVEVPHGFVAGPHNDSLYYACNEDYKLFTKGWWGEFKCKVQEWSNLEKCIEKEKCGEIPLIPNGKVTSQHKPYAQNDSVEIACEDGYQPQIESLICRDGQWSTDGLSPENICQSTFKQCIPPPKVENAVVETSYKKKYLSNSEVIYLCRDEYTMEGENTLRCIDGEWEEKNIKCIPPTQEQ